ncbi:diaminopimelate epimerase [Comamonas flocculans]|uniref:Diaminopimelate epimerase n=2 Tax=Comamonas flocculans TaxID=2597701 RepID=A0A5B8S064_9BURK|nr:diaminopimelate epimerase [Comamonas flocculans]
MHGLGNDFMVLDATREAIALAPGDIRAMADRHFGVGFDQLLLVERAPHASVDFGYRIFNADGGEVEQCGNGARCFARFVREQGLTDKDHIRVQTCGGAIELHITGHGDVRVDMGVPRLLPAEIPFDAPAPALSYPITVEGEALELAVVNMGNPHAVLRVDDLGRAPVARLGPLLERHPRFPARVNVGFMQILTPERIRLRVHERGAGETLACGTGACAAVVAGRRLGWLGRDVTVGLPGGELQVTWPGEGHPVSMLGPATRVYDGLWLWPDAARAGEAQDAKVHAALATIAVDRQKRA